MSSTSMLDRSERACLCIAMYSCEHLRRDINLCLSDTIAKYIHTYTHMHTQ